MNIIKALSLVIILIVPTVLGFAYGTSFIERFHELQEFLRCIVQLENEIVYTHTPLPEAFINIASKSEKPVCDIFENISNLLKSNKVESVYDGFRLSISENRKQINLTKADLNVLFDLGKGLGETDIEGQKKLFCLTTMNLKKQIEEAEVKVKKNVKMYRYLGFSVGAMAVIMLI